MLFIVIHQVYELWFKELLQSSIASCTCYRPTLSRVRSISNSPRQAQG